MRSHGRRPAAAFNLAVKLVVVGLAVYPLLDPNASHFQGKAMGVRALIYPWATVIIPAAWWLRGRPKPYPYLADVALAFPFAFDAAGNVFGWFAISGFDIAPHLLGWAGRAPPRPRPARARSRTRVGLPATG